MDHQPPTSPPLQDWFQEQRRLIAQAWDNIHLCTGEEGTWKSLWMRKCARRIDPKFNVNHIHFTQDAFMEDVASLEPGRAVVLDEFKGHRRQAMHGHRMEFLDWTKDGRELGLNVWIGYPHVSQFERDTLNTRIRYWEHKPSRPLVEIRKRISHLTFDKTGEPGVATKFPLYGTYNLTGANDPLRPAYTVKKQAHMRDGKRFTKIQEEPIRPLLDSKTIALAKVDMAQRALR